jgi:hypothetical protein
MVKRRLTVGEPEDKSKDLVLMAVSQMTEKRPS